uniref:Uncharacterized protein n=1 Tax=Romanomermis culicivorax TaxID=13658 RepID=A0A915J5I4_ROMCU
MVLVDAKETPAFLDTGCPQTIISQRLHKALTKESRMAASAFQQHHNFNPLMSINGKAIHTLLSGPYEIMLPGTRQPHTRIDIHLH